MKKTPNVTIQNVSEKPISEPGSSIYANGPTTTPQGRAVLSKEHIQDGGLEGWLQVFACWLLFMNTWSVIHSINTTFIN
jgi:hypothetical protein